MRRFLVLVVATVAFMLGAQSAQADSICVRPYVDQVTETVCVRLP